SERQSRSIGSGSFALDIMANMVIGESSSTMSRSIVAYSPNDQTSPPVTTPSAPAQSEPTVAAVTPRPSPAKPDITQPDVTPPVTPPAATPSDTSDKPPTPAT